VDEETTLVFLIEGGEYPWPTITSLLMGERRILYDLSGYVQEDFLQLEDESEEEHEERVRVILRHPGVQEALMVIAYARGNPQLKVEKVRALVEKTNWIDANLKNAELEEDAGPPETTFQSEPSSENGSKHDSRSEDSGSPSTSTSAPVDVIPLPTGDTRSGTSSPESVAQM